MRSVILLSGGLDSATCLAIAKADGCECHALTVAYGQRHAVELDAARKVAAHLGAKSHKVIHIDLGAFGGSALTDLHLEVPKSPTPGRRTQDSGPPSPPPPHTLTPPPQKSHIPHPTSHIPITYVPARNTIFLAYALGYAEVLGAGRIYVGVNAVDYSGYPDCRPAFIEAFQRLADLATRAGVEGHGPRIVAPLVNMTKVDIIRRGLELGVDYSLTHSCYDPTPQGRACGRCESCRIRAAAFDAVGRPDQTGRVVA